jgi:hypothetical protein
LAKELINVVLPIPVCPNKRILMYRSGGQFLSTLKEDDDFLFASETLILNTKMKR